MKKYLTIIFAALLLVGCGNKPVEETQTKQEETKQPEVLDLTKKDEEKPEEKQEEAEPNEATGEWESTEMGDRRVTTLKNINETYETGTFKVTINGFQIIEVKPEAELRNFIDKDIATVITVNMTVENTSDQMLNFYPDLAEITTNTKEQIKAEMFLSDSIGGEFKGQIIKEGDVIFVSNSKPEDLTNVKIYIDGPSNNEFYRVGEDLVINIDL